MKKLLAWILVLFTVTSCLPFALAEEEPVKVTIKIRHIGYDTDYDNIIARELNKRLNIDIEWILSPSSNYEQQCTTVIAGGDWPDAMELDTVSYPLDIEQLAEDGTIIPLDDLLAEYGQDIVKTRDKDYLWYTATDGHIYSIACRQMEMANSVWQIRQDWLDKLGLAVPTTSEELHTVLLAFRDNAELLVGKGNTVIPWGYPVGTKSLGIEQMIYGEYGFIAGWNDVDGHATHYVNHPNFKEALRTIRQWYQEGLFDPEWSLMNREQNLEKWYQGVYGAWMNNLDNTEALAGGYMANYMEKHPETKLSYIMPFPSEDGKGRITIVTTWNQMVIFSDTTKEQQIALMKLFNYVITDEGSDLVEMGLEGEHWKDNGDGTADYFYLSEATPEQLADMGYASFCWFMRPNYQGRWNPKRMLDTGRAYAEHIAYPCIITTTPASLEYGVTLGDVLKTRTKLIMDPDIDFDKEFDQMVANWNDWGGAEWTREMDEAYQAKLAQSKD